MRERCEGARRVSILTLLATAAGGMLLVGVTLADNKSSAELRDPRIADFKIEDVENARKIAATMSKDGLLRELLSRKGDEAIADLTASDHPLAPLSLADVAARYDQIIKSQYGDDDRRNVFVEAQVQDDPEIRALADSTVALVLSNRLSEIAGADAFELPGQTFRERKRLCADESFCEEPSASFGSGMLVGEDLVLTAGHCIGNAEFPPSVVRFVFGYRMKDRVTANLHIPKSEIYEAKEVVARKESINGSDWALVRLDRKVEGHRPVPIAKFAVDSPDESLRYIPDHTPVFTLGHPCGLPLKYTAGGEVYVNDRSQPFFSCNLDTYAGNSGSAVLARVDGEYQIVGVLVRGLDDFKDFFELGTRCRRSIVYRLDQAGEACTRSSEFASLVR